MRLKEPFIVALVYIGLFLYIAITLPFDLAHGFWHTFACEVYPRDWQWCDYESQIGDEIYTFKHCSRCRYQQRTLGAYI